MPEDRVTISADASQYFDVLSRAGVAADRLGASGTRVGEGFVRGERVIRRATQNIAGSLLMAGDATSTFLVAASGLERVFKVGIGPTIAVAAGIKGFEILHEAVKKTNDAYKDLKEELEKPINIDPEVDKAQKKIDELRKKIEELQKQLNSPVSKTSGMFAALAAIAGQAFLPSFLRSPVTSALSGLAPVGPGAVNQLIARATTEIQSLSNRREAAFYQSLDRLSEAIRKTADKVQGPFRNLFQDIGSGQFMRDFFQRRAEDEQVRRGQQIASQLDQFQRGGGTLGPIEQAMVDAVRRAGAGGGFSLQDLVNTDFSNLDQLSKYDFSGLAPLSGMTLIVK